MLKDVAGGKDSPVISRFAGSNLVGYAELPYDQATLPLTPEVTDKIFAKPQTYEGRITRLVYLAPIGTTALEVYRNYQDALTKAGYVKKFSCEKEACGRARIQEPFIEYAHGMKQILSYGGYSDTAFNVLNNSGAPYLTWGTLKSGGRDLIVLVYTTTTDGSEGSPMRNRAGTFIEIIEPKAMQMGQVTVDAGAMQKGLAAEGKIALYGVYFDTGRADLKPESKAQLDEMGRLLNADKSLKVFIVGHTDNEGTVDANVALSQHRADAIVAALTRDYRIDPKRLSARGVANYAPVASNDDEAGRARNRRVELVKQ